MDCTAARFATALSDPDPTTLESRRYAFVPINLGQLGLLEQSYAQLKQSVYDGLVLQTRLKPYLDQISLRIDETGIAMDFGALEAANDLRWRWVA